MKEKGGILPSIIIFVWLVLTLLVGTVSSYRSQMYQLRMTKQVYEAKSMLVMSESALKKQLIADSDLSFAKVEFEEGIVLIKKLSSDTYELNVKTKQGLIKKRKSKIDFLLQIEDEEQSVEELEVDKLQKEINENQKKEMNKTATDVRNKADLKEK
ncbi:MAG: hypothetical protein L0K82_06590 [Pisciglobus halotolerans]|nr:hypothetical protein [Pisciglobus halotolerans]